jgi:phosphoglycerol transferase MdoB-like AlkP superfamily enzyme
LFRQANDFLGTILLYAFAIIMGGIPLAILVLTIINLIRATSRRGTIVLQALASIVVWVLLTFVLIMVLMVTILTFNETPSQANEWKSTGVVILGTLIYVGVGAALVYWTKRQAALSTRARTS